MPNIHFEGQDYTCNDNEVVLDCLTRHGVALPSGCRAGSCHACLLRATKGSLPIESQRGLKSTLIDQNYFLPCICKPIDDLEIRLADKVPCFTAHVLEKSWLNEQVLRLRLSKPAGFEYHPGQFINLVQSQTLLVRSYSLASLADENFLELHIKRVPGGNMSNWICDILKIDDEVTFYGPAGHCFYLSGDQHQPLILAGTGTGLAPLYGIVREALQAGHAGDIHLFHASLAFEGLYYVKELAKLADENPSLRYYPCVLHGQAPEGGHVGAIDKVIPSVVKECRGARAYLCGDAPVVDAMQKSVFFAGVNMTDIYADAFHLTPAS